MIMEKEKTEQINLNRKNALADEIAELKIINQQSRLKRWRGYWSKTGPGWMQSAVTLGGATAMTSLFSGVLMQYDMLWVAPIAMLLAIIMLSALSYQTIMTGERPFYSMKKFVHPALAWSWAVATLLATIIWHFPQYVLVSGMTEDVIKVLSGWKFLQGQDTIVRLVLGLLYMVTAIIIVWNYGKGVKGNRRFDLFLKSMIWLIIFSFLFIVINRSIAGSINWADVAKGFISFKIPTDPAGVSVMMGAFSATFGINMAFLFGYSYLKKGWGREHSGLARFDLFTGMFIPFVLATSLMIIATGATLYDPGRAISESIKIGPIEIGGMLETAGVPQIFSRLIFGFGIVAMALNAIIIHMLICGFAACEIFGWEMEGWKYRMACLIPTPGVLGVFFWDSIGIWLAIPASAIAGIMLPIAYIGFFLLNNNEKFLGKDLPRGRKALIWNAGMLLAIFISILAVIYYLIKVI
jgi:manganese transport protein